MSSFVLIKKRRKKMRKPRRNVNARSNANCQMFRQIDWFVYFY